MLIGGYVAEVADLSPNTTEKEVMEFFSSCGEILYLEIVRLSENRSNAYIAFNDAHELQNATLLNGATIGNRCVNISVAKVEESDIGSEDTLMAEHESSAGETNTNQFSPTPPGEAMTVEHVATTMISKGIELTKDALKKAKELDESFQVSTAAAAKAVDLSKRIGLTDRMNSGVETAKSIDEKYNISGVTMIAASLTGKAASAAANVVASNRCFAKGALWVSDLLDRASKSTADLANKGMQK